MNRNIPVQPVYNKLGHRRASVILCFHGQTGLDMSGRFAGRTSEVCMASDNDILNALECLDHRDLSQYSPLSEGGSVCVSCPLSFSSDLQ